MFDNYEKLKREIQSKDKRALGKLISALERNEKSATKFLDEIYKDLAGTFRVGITGPPGVGKSTLLNRILEQLGKSQIGEHIAVLAVDPSSPFTGGAFLGDRVRFRAAGKENIFVRSLASRGALGGLSLRTPEIIELVEAAGFQWIFIETVGVGQSEVEIAKQADITVVVLQPDTGDSMQAMKAGLLEIADLLVVNKADKPLVENFVKTIENIFNMQTQRETPPIILTSAKNNEGINELVKQLAEKKAKIADNNQRAEEYKLAKLKKRIIRRIQNIFAEEILSDEKIDKLVTELSAKLSADEISFRNALKQIISAANSNFSEYLSDI